MCTSGSGVVGSGEAELWYASILSPQSLLHLSHTKTMCSVKSNLSSAEDSQEGKVGELKADVAGLRPT